jgi:tetratricopeptide (TPR) repeat protein
MSAAVPKVDPAARERAGEDFRRMYDQHKEAALAAQLKRYIDQADEALRLDQPVGALNALRVAVKLSSDPALAERLKTVEKQAYAALAKTFSEQGEYEYRNLRFPEAARSFEQALRGQKTAHLHLRVAQSLLDGNDNPRGAVEHAREAVALGPDAPAHHVVLGRAYYAAGLKTSAIGAFERAVTLDPSDASIQDWLRRAKRGEVIEPPVRSRSSRPPKDG